MLNKQNEPHELLQQLGLKRDESKLYLELLKGPSSHLRLAHATGINRTKVYRLADQLEKHGLITSRADDRGTFLEAADPATLEVDLVTQEEKIKTRRQAFHTVLPILSSMKTGDASKFIVHTYDNPEGFKQMLWHELKAKGECLILGEGTIEDLINNRAWAEKHRARTVEAGYTIREILNPEAKTADFTNNQVFLDRHYVNREISRDIITFQQQFSIYNDTVAIYNWREEEEVGIEIINKAFAATMRQIFEHYWRLAEQR